MINNTYRYVAAGSVYGRADDTKYAIRLDRSSGAGSAWVAASDPEAGEFGARHGWDRVAILADERAVSIEQARAIASYALRARNPLPGHLPVLRSFVAGDLDVARLTDERDDMGRLFLNELRCLVDHDAEELLSWWWSALCVGVESSAA